MNFTKIVKTGQTGINNKACFDENNKIRCGLRQHIGQFQCPIPQWDKFYKNCFVYGAEFKIKF